MTTTKELESRPAYEPGYSDVWDIDYTVDKKDNFSEAADKVDAFIKQQKLISLGALSREFPEYVRMLDTILVSLRREGRVNWCDFKPMPTMISTGTKLLDTCDYDWKNRRLKRKWVIE